MTLEKKLVRLRKKEGISQADVSEKLNVSRQAVSRWEAGDSRPSTENLQALCKLYTWGITSNAGGAMVFTGTVSTNRGQIFVLGDIEFDGDCGGTIDNVTTLKGKNTATLSGFMIDSRGISITAPDVSSNYYR